MARLSLMGGFAVATLAALALSAALATLISAITAGSDSPMRGSCMRECHPGEHYTCQFDFKVHSFQTYSWNCKTCGNFSCTDHPGCIQADGITRLITVVNEQLPGPALQVCEGDTVKVTVRNYLVSSGVSIHWHGISMRGENGEQGSPHMDGEPGITQCPIMPHTKFTYSFVANPPGTHFWHAQTGFQRGDGVFGSLIVRSPKDFDPNYHLYDEDLADHVMMLNDWTYILGEEKFFLHLLGGFTDYPKSILVNGLGPHEGNGIAPIPHTVKHQRFQVVEGTKYRFRLISGAFLNCPISVTIDDHLLTVIATDGAPVTPYNVTSIVIHPGERWDFVLHANQYPQPYWISFVGQKDCLHDSVYQTAILDYVQESRFTFRREEKTRKVLPDKPKPRFTKDKPRGKQINGLNGICDFDNPCLRDLKSVRTLPEELNKERADLTFFFGFTKMMVNQSFVKGHFPRILRQLQIPPNVRLPVPLINGFTFNNPATPVILQTNSYETCDHNSNANYLHDECLHIVKIPLGSVTDLALVEEDPHDEGSIVHLHGYRFYLLSEQWGPLEGYHSWKNTNVEFVRELDSKGQIRRNLDNPIRKDTISIPHKGYVIIRFLADNPGFWVLESQLLFDSQLGMKVILQVGQPHEIPKSPSNFPHCGDFH